LAFSFTPLLLLIVQIEAFKGRIIHKEVKRRCAFKVSDTYWPIWFFSVIADYFIFVKEITYIFNNN